MCAAPTDTPRLQNPKTWPKPVQTTLEWIVAQLHFAHALLRERLLDSGLSFFPQFVGLLDRSLLERTQAEELALLHARFSRTPSRHRPHYNSCERVAILLLMMRNAWSVSQASKRLIVSESSIRSWMKDFLEGTLTADKQQIPHNKYSEIVAWIAHEIEERYPVPESGYGTIAHLIAQNGIACSKSTAWRKLKLPKPMRPPAPKVAKTKPKNTVPFHVLAPTAINRTWHMDLTVIRVLWFEFIVAAILDGYSRKLLTIKAYAWHPDTKAMLSLLRETIREHGRPRFLVTDHGPLFRKRFKKAIERRGTYLINGKAYSPEFNGKIERWFRTLKIWQRISLPFLSLGKVQAQLETHRDWYNGVRPHQSLGGRTPDEVWNNIFRPPPQPILARDLVKPAVAISIDDFRGDKNLPVVRIDVLCDAKRVA